MAEAAPAPVADPNPPPASPPPAANTPPAAPAAAPPASPPPATLADGGDDDGKEVTIQADWPEDWRQKLAGADEEAAKRIARFSSPQTLFKALREAEKKLSSSRPSEPLPEKATEEQVAKWRKDNGIPDTPDGYHKSLDGLVIGETDKPVVDALLERAHSKNISPAAVKEMLGFYYESIGQQEAQMQETIALARSEASDLLHKEFGDNYRGNMNAFKGWFEGTPEGFKEKVFGARLPDGTMLGDNPDFIRFGVAKALEANPAATIAPASGSNMGKSIVDEIASIEKMMGDRNSDYWRDEKIQKRYLALVDARQRMGAKAA